MESLSIFLLLLLPVLSPAQQCSTQGDCVGFSLGQDYFATERQCLEFCKATPECQWYSHDKRNGFCNALYNCQQLDTSCATCISGENDCSFPLQCDVTGSCTGIYIDHFNATSKEECLQKCYEGYPNCNWFSYFALTKVCSVYATCSLDESQTNLISGERGCFGNPDPVHSKVFLQYLERTAWMQMPSYHAGSNGTTCTQTPSYPLNLYGAAGQVIDGRVMICGGWGYKECFSYNENANSWVEFSSLDTNRGWAASVNSPKGWWITGGNNSPVRTTRLLVSNAWTVGPELPIPLFMHCMVQINETHTFVGGGADNDYSDQTFMFNWNTERWTELPLRPVENYAHGCALFTDTLGNQRIIMAGGSPFSNAVHSLNLAALEEWEQHADLPTSADDGQMFYDGDSLILASGASGRLLRFNPATFTFIVITGQTLPVFGGPMAMIPITDGQLHDTCSNVL